MSSRTRTANDARHRPAKHLITYDTFLLFRGNCILNRIVTGNLELMMALAINTIVGLPPRRLSISRRFGTTSPPTLHPDAAPCDPGMAGTLPPLRMVDPETPTLRLVKNLGQDTAGFKSFA